MALVSRAFSGDPKLEACLVSDPAHITPGAAGAHVAKIQNALMLVGGARIAEAEIMAKQYGPSTAAAVLAFKTARKIINYAYQNRPDNIVGKMTIAALDQEMSRFERSLRELNSCAGKPSSPPLR